MSKDVVTVEKLHPVVIQSVLVLSANFNIRAIELCWWLVIVDLISSIVKASQLLVDHHNCLFNLQNIS